MLRRLVSDSLIKKNPIFVECLLLASQVALVVKNPPANARDIKLEFDHRVGKIPWRRYGNPFQYSCLVNPHGQRSLVGYSPYGRKELDTTEVT